MGVGITCTPEGGGTQSGRLRSADDPAERLRAGKQNGTTGPRTSFGFDGTASVLELDASGAVLSRHGADAFGGRPARRRRFAAPAGRLG